jgi:hypothetical protein
VRVPLKFFHGTAISEVGRPGLFSFLEMKLGRLLEELVQGLSCDCLRIGPRVQEVLASLEV